jgi:WD40 repeat protein/serine/threonine protein kinase
MAEVPTSDWSWIDAAERFKRAWSDSQRPRIEEFLVEVPEPQWRLLLCELIRVEGELRRRDGEEPGADEYRRRFPGHEELIDAVFESAPAATTAAVDAGSDRSTSALSPTRPLASALPPELASHPDYEIVRELGHGGMGVVYLAHNRIMARHEVLKVIGPQIAEQPGVTDRFLREIRAVARLRHPNIVSAYSAFRCGGSLVFAMEYAEGLDLRRMVQARGPIPVVRACYYARHAALALQHAHEEGMVHRDIKPGNLMLTHHKGRALIKVLDFGLSKAVSEQSAAELGIGLPARPVDLGGHLTCAGDVLGTPEFIAPEQITNAQGADIRADIYSLGCTLYYLLTGRPPFQSATILGTLEAHRSMDPPPLDRLCPEVPAELTSLVARMMAKEPDRRFQTPGEVADALASFYKKPTAAAGSGDELWSSLIDFRETEEDKPAMAAGPDPARAWAQWLWPAAGAGVLVCGLIGTWAITTFRGAPAKNDGVERAVAEPNIGAGESPRVRVAQQPLDPPEPASPAPPSAGPVAPTPTPDVNTAAAPAAATGMPPPDAAPPRPSKPPAPRVQDAKSVQVFHKIAAIKSPDSVLQARLISDSGQVLFETDGRNRALYRVDLKDPETPSKLEAGVPAWAHLAVSSDGQFAVLVGMDQSLWHWDIRTGQAHCLLRTARGRISMVALSPDHQVVAYVRDGTIQFCDVTADAAVNKKALSKKLGQQTELIAFSADGRRIVSTHADQSIRIWDVKTRQAIRYTEAPKPVSALAAFPDGRHALISLSGPTLVWDLEKGRQLRQAPGFGESLVLSADGRRALVGGGKTMHLWDLVTGDDLERGEHERTVQHVAFSSDERQAVSVTADGIHVWVLPPARAAGEVPAVVEAADFSREGGNYDGVAVSPDGRLILTAQYPPNVRLRDRETGRLIRAFDLGGKATRGVVFSPDGSLALFGDIDGVVRLLDLVTGEHREFRGHANGVAAVAFSPDGRRAYSAGGGLGVNAEDREATDFAVRVWDLETGQQLSPLEGHKGTIRDIAISPDGRHLVSAGSDAVAILWDARTGRLVHRLAGHTGPVTGVAFLPDGRRALSTSDDSTIRLWDVESGREVFDHFKDPTGHNHRLAVSPDGHRLFTNGSWDEGDGLRYWNLDTGRLIQTLRWEVRPTRGAFNPDGRHVIWGGTDGVLRVYRLTDLPDRPFLPSRRSPNPRKRSSAPGDPISPNDRGKAHEDPGKPDTEPQ